MTQWKERLDDIRRKPGSHSNDGDNDKPDRGTAESYGRDDTGITGTGQAASVFQEQNQSLKNLNSELSGLLNLLPDTEELLSQIEQQKTRIEQLETENQQWQELTQKLNSENSLLQKQNTELLTLNSR